MTVKKSNPATLGKAGRARNAISVAAIGSENTPSHIDPQQLRVVFLARRFGLTPAMAAGVAVLHFGEARR